MLLNHFERAPIWVILNLINRNYVKFETLFFPLKIEINGYFISKLLRKVVSSSCICAPMHDDFGVRGRFAPAKTSNYGL